jgi:hypothetical protein
MRASTVPARSLILLRISSVTPGSVGSSEKTLCSAATV